MSLCEHGYTANWDCPICECNCGSGKPAGECRCIAADVGVGIFDDAPKPDPATARSSPKEH